MSSFSSAAIAPTKFTSAAPATEVRVSFATKHENYRISEASIVLPTKLARYGLSEVINHMLGTENSPVPFEFLYENRIVTGSLRDLIARLQLSTENILCLDYQPAMSAPEKGPPSFEAPDWISCIDGGVNNCCIVGCYDGVARVLDRDSLTTVLGSTGSVFHTAPIKAVALINGNQGALAITGSQDHTIVVWDTDLSDVNGESGKCTLIARAQGAAHEGEVTCVAVDPERKFVCSGSWDKTAVLWSLNKDDDSEVMEGIEKGEEDEDDNDNVTATARASKRRKTTTEVEQPPRLKSLKLFEGHKDAVTGVAWASSRSLFTGSYDHKIVSWDVETGEQIGNVMYGNKAVTDLSYNPRTALLASSHPDHVVRVWDPRVGANEVAPITLKSHTNWVTSVRW
jgi:ribosome biogenesis protein YTM1